MTFATSLRSLALLLGFLLPLCAAAQNLPEGATANKDKCLGYELPYKKYSRAQVNRIQADLFQIYQEDPEWKVAASQRGQPLNDSYMGPITWSWMQRFCGHFALAQAADIVSEFPVRLTAIAGFAQQHPTEVTQLVSREFAVWSVNHHTACTLNTQDILYRGSDAQLLQLLRCYQDSVNPPPTIEPSRTTATKVDPHRLYVLREEDFVALEKPEALVEWVKKLIDKPFADEASAALAINDLLKDQTEEWRNQIREQIIAKLTPQNTYQLTDGILESLFKSGIGDALFVELKAVPQTVYTTEESFKTVIRAAIEKASAAEISATATNPTPSGEGQAPVNSTVDNPANIQPSTSQSSTSQSNTIQTNTSIQKNQANLLLIVLASKQKSLLLTEESAQSIISTIPHFPPRLIQLLRVLKDIEYPEGELLHYAVQNKLIKGLLICKVDKPNTLDINIDRLSPTEKEELRTELATIFPSSVTESTDLPICNETHYQNIQREYNQSLRGAIEQVYSEPMPEYNALDIQWSGDACGCVPKEIATTAYGIYPYWHTTETPQKFDFSTFSRVAYFGLSVNNNGHLVQINAKNQAQTLVHSHTESNKAFISTARRYGSKVDWIIEKDWSEYSNEAIDSSTAPLEAVLNNLKLNIVTLLATPLTDVESVLRPYLSLGIAAQPTNGDGVTLYFKNFPTSDAAKKIFESFFNNLKQELKVLAEKRDSFHQNKNRIYVNLLIKQDEFTADEGVFTSINIDQLLNTQQLVDRNLSQIEMQDEVQSVVVLMLEEPYYSALDEIYALTSGTSRSLIMPMMIANYADMNKREQRDAMRKGMASDERFKKLAYIHESFGGGAFWPITAWDKPGYEGFNDYVATHFAPGYSESGWNEKLCAYRWQLISIMNIWLIVAIIFVLIVFYIYPQKCKKLPPYIDWLSKPATVVILLLPPIALWDYLLLVDKQFPFFSLPSLLCLSLIGLAVWAGIDSIKELKKVKPNRNLLQYQKAIASPTRTTATPGKGDEIDDTDTSDTSK